MSGDPKAGETPSWRLTGRLQLGPPSTWSMEGVGKWWLAQGSVLLEPEGHLWGQSPWDPAETRTPLCHTRHFLASAQWLCSPSWVPCKAVATLTFSPSFSGSQSPPAFP